MKLRILWLAAAGALVGCGGSGGGSNGVAVAVASATPLATSTPTVASLAYALRENVAIPYMGGSSAFTDGDTSIGGSGAPIDGISCTPGSTNYHVHVHVSIINGNAQVFMPQAIGIVTPVAATGTAPNTYVSGGSCVYDLHTHDHSGILHVESAAQPATPFTLGQFFDIWGQPLSSTQVATLSGDVHIYTTVTAVDANGIAQPSAVPQEWLSPYSAIPLVPHQEITIVVRPSNFVFPRYVWPANL